VPPVWLEPIWLLKAADVYAKPLYCTPLGADHDAAQNTVPAGSLPDGSPTPEPVLDASRPLYSFACAAVTVSAARPQRVLRVTAAIAIRRAPIGRLPLLFVKAARGRLA
jgi:hypothetical protein